MALTFALYYDAARTQPVPSWRWPALTMLGQPDTAAAVCWPGCRHADDVHGWPADPLSVVSTGDVQPGAFRLALTQADLGTAVRG
jgi:hypothetical protein